MKYLFVLLALGALICTTYAAPASTDIQQENANSKDEEFLDMLSRVTKATHQTNDDDDGADDTPAEAQWGFFKKLFHKVRRSRLLRRYGGRVLGHVIRSYMNQRDNRDEENALIEAAHNSKLESIVGEQGDDDDGGDDVGAIQNDIDDDDDSLAEAQWGFFKKLFRKVRRSRLLRRYGGRILGHAIRSYMNQRDNRDEENALIEAALNSKLESIAGDDDDGGDDVGAIQNDLDDDDNSSAEAQWGFFKRFIRRFLHKKFIKKLAKKVLGGVVRSHMNPQQGNGGEELENIAKEQEDGYSDGDDDGKVIQSNEDDDDSPPAEAQWGFFKKWFRKLRRYRKPFKKLVGKVISGVIRSHMNPLVNGLMQSDNDDDDDDIADAAENDTAVAQAFLEKLLERDTDNMIMAAIESLPEEAQAQFLSSV